MTLCSNVQQFALKLILIAGTAAIMLGAPVWAGVAAQSATIPPAATAYKAQVSYTSTCSPASSCAFILYRASGACPSQGWQQVGPMSAAGATTLSDTSIAYGNTYSYEVEAVDGAAHSGPSACVTVTVPGNPPAAPGAPAVTITAQ